ncbi:hypothetical protein BG011_001297, partial [Mortierella polycephala]
MATGQQLNSLLRGRVGDFDGFNHSLGLDITRSSSAPPNQLQHQHQGPSSRFGHFSPGGFEATALSESSDLFHSESLDYLGGENHGGGSDSDRNKSFLPSSRQEPRTAQTVQSSSSQLQHQQASMYSPGLSWQLWSSSSSSTSLTGTTGLTLGSDDPLENPGIGLGGSNDLLSMESRIGNTDPALLWRQDIQSPEMSKSETHSPLLLNRKGFDTNLSNSSINAINNSSNSSSNNARSAASMPTSPKYGTHTPDHLNHIWAPGVSSPSAEFPRSPSPLFSLPSVPSQHQSHSSMLYQSLTSSQSMRSPIAAPSTLRHEISDSLEQSWQNHSSELDSALSSDDLDDGSSQLKSVLNAALDVGEDERLSTIMSARSPLFQTKFAPPQRSSSTPPTQGHPFSAGRYPPGLASDFGAESSQSDLEYGMQNLRFGEYDDDLAMQHANLRRQQLQLNQQQLKLQQMQMQQQRQHQQHLQQAHNQQQQHHHHGSHTPVTTYSPYFDGQNMLKDPRMMGPQFGYDLPQASGQNDFQVNRDLTPAQKDLHSMMAGHDEASLGFRANDLAYDPRFIANSGQGASPEYHKPAFMQLHQQQALYSPHGGQVDALGSPTGMDFAGNSMRAPEMNLTDVRANVAGRANQATAEKKLRLQTQQIMMQQQQLL